MSYNGSSESATWEGRWISDYTYNVLFGQMRTSGVEEALSAPLLLAADNSVVISALVNPVTQQALLNPAWVYPTAALSSGLVEKWQAMQAENWTEDQLSAGAVSYHLRLRNASGTTLADYTLTPIENEVHEDETYHLVFMQTFSAPVGTVTRLDLMADSTVLATLRPGASAPAVTILQPAGGEVYTDQMTINWRASDPDADDRFLFNVQY
jgi:hypothetical protein